MNTSLLLLFGFAVVMIGIGLLAKRKNTGTSIEEFLVSSRDLSVFRGSFSIAISWVWAPAIFIAGLQKSLHKGIARGILVYCPQYSVFFPLRLCGNSTEEKISQWIYDARVCA